MGNGDAMEVLDMPYGALASWGRLRSFDRDSVSQAPQQHFNVDIVAPAWRVGIRGSLVCMLQAGDMIV